MECAAQQADATSPFESGSRSLGFEPRSPTAVRLEEEEGSLQEAHSVGSRAKLFFGGELVEFKCGRVEWKDRQGATG